MQRKGVIVMFDKKLREEIVLLDAKIAHLQEIVDKKPDRMEKDHLERIADLEVKMAKLWSLLTEKTINNNDKLSKFGRKFGGMANLQERSR